MTDLPKIIKTYIGVNRKDNYVEIIETEDGRYYEKNYNGNFVLYAKISTEEAVYSIKNAMK